jgi:ElaB/YqjD/DUF883 family membrane-anchored ribosome-binding protein
MTDERFGYAVEGSRDTTRQAVHQVARGAEQRIRDATTGAQEWLTEAREFGAQAQHAARRFKPYAEASMRERPMTTLGVACAIGFLLGALWKR